MTMRTAMIKRSIQSTGLKNYPRYIVNSEAATWVEGARKGQLKNIDPEKLKQCDLCEGIYHEAHEGRQLNELIPVCAIRDFWVKKWMMQHESFGMHDPLSLDQSHYNDDETVRQVAEDAIVVPTDPEKAKELKCGEHCCAD